MKISLKIVTPERVVYEDEVDSVTAMTESGEVTILPGHVPLVANLRAGEMHCMKGSETVLLAASTGFLEVRGHNEVVVLADTAERVEELEVAKIEEAKERARQMVLETQHVDAESFAAAAAALDRELARYKVAMKRHGKIPHTPES